MHLLTYQWHIEVDIKIYGNTLTGHYSNSIRNVTQKSNDKICIVLIVDIGLNHNFLMFSKQCPWNFSTGADFASNKVTHVMHNIISDVPLYDLRIITRICLFSLDMFLVSHKLFN